MLGRNSTFHFNFIILLYFLDFLSHKIREFCFIYSKSFPILKRIFSIFNFILRARFFKTKKDYIDQEAGE